MSAYRDTSQRIGWSFTSFHALSKAPKLEEVKVTPFEPLKRDLTKLEALHQELKDMIDELEKSLKD